jgi:hypothetical protein
LVIWFCCKRFRKFMNSRKRRRIVYRWTASDVNGDFVSHFKRKEIRSAKNSSELSKSHSKTLKSRNKQTFPCNFPLYVALSHTIRLSINYSKLFLILSSYVYGYLNSEGGSPATDQSPLIWDYVHHVGPNELWIRWKEFGLLV